jgi:hypothetical protein
LVPDLSGGMPALRDVLVAFEWLRMEWPAMAREVRGNFLCTCTHWKAPPCHGAHPERSLV